MKDALRQVPPLASGPRDEHVGSDQRSRLQEMREQYQLEKARRSPSPAGIRARADNGRGAGSSGSLPVSPSAQAGLAEERQSLRSFLERQQQLQHHAKQQHQQQQQKQQQQQQQQQQQDQQ